MTPDTTTRFVLPSFAQRGRGFAWVAENLRPWTPEDTAATQFLQGRHLLSQQTATFDLQTGGVYFINHPTRPVNDEEPTSERYHLYVPSPGVTQIITREEATDLLRRRELATSPTNKDEWPEELTAMERR